MESKKATSIVNASFGSATFSDRIWMYQDMLKADLSKLLQEGLIQGRNPRQLATHLQKRFGACYSDAVRLMRTELARVQIDAQKQSFERNGFEEYQFIAEPTACPTCRALDGKVFKVNKMLPAKNAPPMHPNCRCSVAAYEDSEEYEKWLDFLSKGGTTEEWNNLKSKQKSSGKTVEKGSGSDIISSSSTKEDIQVHSVGKINRDIYKCITEDIVTDEVVITDNQMQHILDRHPEAYKEVVDYLSDIIREPDFIISDKHENTGLAIKKIKTEKEYAQMVLRICTSNDNPNYKNSVISCWEISEKRLQNYLRNKIILYKRE